MIDFDTVFLVGPQGLGKGTQGKRLAAKLGFLYWGTGDILRAASHEDTPLGRELASEMGKGALLSDELMLRVAEQKLDAIPAGTGVVFDGIPRRVAQADFMLEFARREGRKRPLAIFLDLPREEAKKRLLAREKIEGRADDTPEGIEARLRAYDEVIRPTIEYLKDKTTFVEIDGRPSMDEVEKSIDAAIGIQ